MISFRTIYSVSRTRTRFISYEVRGPIRAFYRKVFHPKLCKTEFKIVGTEMSRHASGNRCIIAVRKSTAVVQVLLVYSKGDIGGANETAGWKAVIKDNYPEYKDLL